MNSETRSDGIPVGDPTERRLVDIEVVEDRTAGSLSDQGFLRIRRLVVRNRYADGSTSRDYPCDIVRRPHEDAVALVLYQESRESGHRRILVTLKESPRVPIYLRKDSDLVIPDPQPYLTIVELAAGLIEREDSGRGGLERRASAEAREEVGYDVPLERVARLGDGSFASPGTSVEKVYFCRADIAGERAGRIEGDGSAMEEATTSLVLDLREAILRCRDGRIPDMKTEVGLVRLADSIGYLPAIDRFVDELDDDRDGSLSSESARWFAEWGGE